MKWITFITFLLIALAACITVVFVKALKPANSGAFMFFAIWLILPYALMSAALILVRRKETTSGHRQVVAVMVSIGGILFMADAIFWHPDAQGAIAVLMIPVLQVGAAALLLPVVSWLLRNARP